MRCAGTGPFDLAGPLIGMRRLPISIAIAAATALAGCGDRTDSAPHDGSKVGGITVDVNSADFKKRMQARLDEMRKEEAVREEAPWFGRTGLSDDEERELPRYLRREFGTLLSEPGSLKAADVEYLGVFVEGVETVHFWRIHYGSPEPKFAYVVSAPAERAVMGWGDRKPPR